MRWCVVHLECNKREDDQKWKDNTGREENEKKGQRKKKKRALRAKKNRHEKKDKLMWALDRM